MAIHAEVSGDFLLNPLIIMSSTSETGHAINVANFKQLTTTCTYFGAPYNPVNLVLKLTALNTKAAQADSAMAALDAAEAVYNVKIQTRAMVFAPLDALATRIGRAYASMGPNPVNLKRVKALIKKIQGRRASDPDEPEPDADGNAPEPNTISASQKSFDNRVSNFGKLIQLLLADPVYQPNEADLTVAALQAHYADLNSKNADVRNALAPLQNARAERDRVLYHPETGLVPIGLKAKDYVLGAFGSKSAQYAQVKGILFKKYKVKL